MVKLQFAVTDGGVYPTKKDEDAGYDIYADWGKEPSDSVVIMPGEIHMFHTSLYSVIDTDHWIQIAERGSTGSKGMAVRAGVIDSGYRDEWLILINNTSDKPLIFVDPDKMDSLTGIEISKIINEHQNRKKRMAAIKAFNELKNINEITDENAEMIAEMAYELEANIQTKGEDFSINYTKNQVTLVSKKKAICQAVPRQNEAVDREEVDMSVIANAKSERGTGKLGSSGK